MFAATLIALREGFEAALILSIVLAYLRKIDRQDAFKQVWIGVGAAFGLAATIGVVAYQLIGGLGDSTRNIVFAAVSLGAVAVLTWMLFWMRRQARTISKHLREQVDEALASGSTWGVVSVAFFAVLRESIETVLLMLAIVLGTSPLQWLLGLIVGLSGAIVLGYMIYQGGRRINLGLFFNITGGMVLIIAAGLIAKGVAWLQASGVLPTFYWPVWNVVDNPIVGHGEFAALMAGLFGWNPRPSIEEVGVWALYLVIFGYLFFVAGRSKQTRPAERQATVGQKA